MRNNLIEKALGAYGGRDLWERAKQVKAKVSTQGLAFTLKGRPCFNHSTLLLEVHRPFCSITPIGRNPDVTGVLDGKCSFA